MVAVDVWDLVECAPFPGPDEPYFLDDGEINGNKLLDWDLRGSIVDVESKCVSCGPGQCQIAFAVATSCRRCLLGGLSPCNISGQRLSVAAEPSHHVEDDEEVEESPRPAKRRRTIVPQSDEAAPTPSNRQAKKKNKTHPPKSTYDHVIKLIRWLEREDKTRSAHSLRFLRSKVIELPIDEQRLIQTKFNLLWARMVAVNVYTDRGFEKKTILELLNGKGRRGLALDNTGRTLDRRVRFGFWDLDPTAVDEDEKCAACAKQKRVCEYAYVVPMSGKSGMVVSKCRRCAMEGHGCRLPVRSVAEEERESEQKEAQPEQQDEEEPASATSMGDHRADDAKVPSRKRRRGCMEESGRHVGEAAEEPDEHPAANKRSRPHIRLKTGLRAVVEKDQSSEVEGSPQAREVLILLLAVIWSLISCLSRSRCSCAIVRKPVFDPHTVTAATSWTSPGSAACAKSYLHVALPKSRPSTRQTL
ncbi:hypothetical protein CYLTODRAFT_61631 [Cylindrobasidium torrendii FP15055 ss-10]|uniref:Uncharacterized protein n=1 Tax=Cylindrobasidium torrendii FP15055 ss-10 TaxID=1314674 RepID=A0A0D7B5I7_9AGAR|nr:hypothetical protein CYLTODRAFT_61631 [Cylindrobasidium torrendii FP15055 ss-10]